MKKIIEILSRALFLIGTLIILSVTIVHFLKIHPLDLWESLTTYGLCITLFFGALAGSNLSNNK